MRIYNLLFCAALICVSNACAMKRVHEEAADESTTKRTAPSAVTLVSAEGNKYVIPYDALSLAPMLQTMVMPELGGQEDRIEFSIIPDRSLQYIAHALSLLHKHRFLKGKEQLDVVLRDWPEIRELSVTNELDFYIELLQNANFLECVRCMHLLTYLMLEKITVLPPEQSDPMIDYVMKQLNESYTAQIEFARYCYLLIGKTDFSQTIKAKFRFSVRDYVDFKPVRVNVYTGQDHYQECNLSGLHINSLDGLDAIPNIEQCQFLKLFNNDLEDLAPRQFVCCSQLIFLLLGNNHIMTINPDAFDGVQGLSILDLSDNHLAEITSVHISKIPRLRHLNLSYNQLTHLNGNFFKSLTNLIELDLSFNKLTILTPEMIKPLQRLQQLYLSDNPLVYLDPAIFETLDRLQGVWLINTNLSEENKKALNTYLRSKEVDVFID